MTYYQYETRAIKRDDMEVLILTKVCNGMASEGWRLATSFGSGVMIYLVFEREQEPNLHRDLEDIAGRMLKR